MWLAIHQRGCVKTKFEKFEHFYPTRRILPFRGCKRSLIIIPHLWGSTPFLSPKLELFFTPNFKQFRFILVSFPFASKLQLPNQHEIEKDITD